MVGGFRVLVFGGRSFLTASESWNTESSLPVFRPSVTGDFCCRARPPCANLKWCVAERCTARKRAGRFSLRSRLNMEDPLRLRDWNPRRPELMPLSISARQLWKPLLVVAAVAFAYWGVLARLGRFWWEDENYSHGL